jgi:WD40 repeat protein
LTWDRLFAKDPIVFQHKNGITSIKFITDDKIIASDDSGKIMLYSTKSSADRSPIKLLSGHQKNINW